MEEVPPELATDILDRGIMLTVGGALLKGLNKVIRAEIQMPVFIAEMPLDCVGIGTGKAFENIHLFNKNTKLTKNF